MKKLFGIQQNSNENQLKQNAKEYLIKDENKDGRKLPKNFANKVLELELKIDSGNFDINSVDKLI